MSERVLLHSVAGRPGSALARRLHRSTAPYGELRPLVGPFSRPIVRISGSDDLLAEAAGSLPDGAARLEAMAVRLRRLGVELSWGEPDLLPDASALLRVCEARGASSVELVRIDPSLLTEMQIGSFFHAYWRRRTLRHALLRLRMVARVTSVPATFLDHAADLAFWAGVRSSATPQEWSRFARSSYVVFYYHRIGRGGWPGHENLDLEVRRFEQHLRLLRMLRFRALSPAEVIAFHDDPRVALSPRSFVLTADDAFRDTVYALSAHGHLRPQVFVNTFAVGGTPPWTFKKPVATWDELESFAAVGGVVASHCRRHPRLPELKAEELADELSGSLHDVRARFPAAPLMLAYPHGLHDERVCSAAEAAGYQAAFTTYAGRNGAGIDRYCLRRIGVKNWDGNAVFLWKALTGERWPWPLERLRMRYRQRMTRRMPTSGAAASSELHRASAGHRSRPSPRGPSRP
jgi:Polysaccharide deacetylase